MTDPENSESTSAPARTLADKTTGTTAGSRGPSQSHRVTFDSVRETIGTRRATLLERRTLPRITERKLIAGLCLAL